MKLSITKEFCERLQDAFAITDFKSVTDREKRVFLLADVGKVLLYSVSTNDGLYARINASRFANVIEPGSVVLTMRLCKFLSYYEKNFPDDVTIEVDDSATIVAINGKKEIVLNNLSKDNYQEAFTSWETHINESSPIATFNPYEPISKALLFCDSGIEARFVLSGIRFYGDEKGLSISATDGKRLFSMTKPIQCAQFTKILPSAGLRKIIKYLRDDVAIYYNSDDIFFHVGDYIFKLVSLNGSYPDLNTILYGSRGERNAFVDKSELLNSITKVATVLDDSSFGKVSLTFKDSSLTVSATDATYGQATKTLLCRYNKPEITISFAVEYLMSVVRVCEKDTIEMFFNENTPVHLIDEEAIVVVMPVS